MLKNGPTVCEVVAGIGTSTLHRSGVAASQDDAELVAERRFRNRGFPVEMRNQAAARFFVGGAVEYWIKREQSIAGKVHLRDEARREGWSENRKMDMGGPPGIVVIAPGIPPGTHGTEAIAPFTVPACLPPT